VASGERARRDSEPALVSHRGPRLWFETPPGLVYKTSGWAKKPRAAVDLYVADHGFTGTAEQLETLLSELERSEGVLRHNRYREGAERRASLRVRQGGALRMAANA
jgi:hypothetical protein